MNEMTAFGNLSKLVDGGVVRKTWNKIDVRTKYYELIDKELAEIVIKKFKSIVAFRLARFVPYKQTLAEQLQTEKKFIEACQFYGLTISDGIQAVKMCPKIGNEWNSNKLILWRMEQGYDKELEVEEVE